jgi:hypothetical protein
MHSKVFSHINRIIERESKSSTYKFALLRGVIDMVRDNSPYIGIMESPRRVYFPLGLLAERWIVYYYPLLEASVSIPQINGEKARLAFEKPLRVLIAAYGEQGRGGFSAFYRDFRNGQVPAGMHGILTELIRKIIHTVTAMPMKHIGQSVYGKHYAIFEYEKKALHQRHCVLDLNTLAIHAGSFSIPYEYYEAFRMLGSFIHGQDSILMQWAEFSAKASGDHLNVYRAVSEILREPVTEREILAAKKVYRNALEQEGEVTCVWTGEKLRTYDIDHMIPFSIWKNNDLWNLLPARASVNNSKRDKVPEPELVLRQADHICRYWTLMDSAYPTRFQSELQVALLGRQNDHYWQEAALSQLQKSCGFLINERGYTPWQPK